MTTAIKTDAFAAITEITVYAPDHPRLLALLFGACTAANANIVGAQIFTTTDGMALDTILLQREFADEADDEQRKAERVCDTIKRTLRGQMRLRDALATAHKRPRACQGLYGGAARHHRQHAIQQIHGDRNQRT